MSPSDDRAAVERLLRTIRPLIVRYCRARLASLASADAVAREICMSVLSAWPTYREQGRSLLAFVYGIAAQKVATVPDRELSEQLRLLPERLREILVLRVVVGLSAEETAEAVGSTPSAVRLAQHRALARLRKAIGDTNG